MNKGIAISGFGRIGRVTLRAALRDKSFVPVAIGDIKDPVALAQLFKADTNYGLWPEEVRYTEPNFFIGDRRIRYFNTENGLPNWKELGVSIIIECTGLASRREWSQEHLSAGAETVIVSAPCKTTDDCDATILVGFNLDDYDPTKHKIISMASCTTNGLAPLVKVLDDAFGIETGLFTTVHAYTNSQSLTDQPMKDRRDSWAAGENIIPSSSGAAKALKLILPGPQITGKAYRVPLRTGSIVELNAVVKKSGVSREGVNEAFRKAERETQLGTVMGTLDDEWASARILGETKSCVVDLPLTQVTGSLVSVAGWYDNEMGYATRLAELAACI